MDVTDDATSSRPPLILSIYGNPGGGKSRFCGTCPGDIGVIALEYKSLPSIIKSAKEFGKRVIVPSGGDGNPVNLVRNSRAAVIAQIPAHCVTSDDFKQYSRPEEQEKAAARQMQAITKKIRYTDPMPSCCQLHTYRWLFSREKACGLMLAEMPNVKTIVIDTFGQFVEDCLFACYGRLENIMPLDRKSFNQEIRDFLNCISGKNVILTHHSSDVWADNKPTGRTKPENTFRKIGHYCTAITRLNRDKKADASRGEPFYTMLVEDCTARPDLIGETLEDEAINFDVLAGMVHPEVGEW
jgi:hypothetical protein